jgi:cytochrome b subunit of formate dehydrogenase
MTNFLLTLLFFFLIITIALTPITGWVLCHEGPECFSKLVPMRNSCQLEPQGATIMILTCGLLMVFNALGIGIVGDKLRLW